MCGRFVFKADEAALARWSNLPLHEPVAARYNIAPTQPVLCVRNDHSGGPIFDHLRWGLIPSWVKDPSNMSLIINARIETVLEKPSFRHAIQRRRCLLPASGFFEWKPGKGRNKTPYFVYPSKPDHRGAIACAFAGIWESWTGSDGAIVDSLAILTGPARGPIADIHHRMPLVVDEADEPAWLNTVDVPGGEALGIVGPKSDDFWAMHPVNPRANTVDGPGDESLLEVAPEEEPRASPDQQMSLF